MLRILLYMIRWMVAMSFIVSVSGQAQTATYLHLSDVHLDLTGESRDTDPQLWSITKTKLKSILESSSPPAFVLYTGDLPGHYRCHNANCALQANQVPAHNANVRVMLADLHSLIADTSIPLLYIPGNNDSLAGDYFSFTDNDDQTPLSLKPYEHYPAPNSSAPCGTAPCMASNPDPALGYYSARPVTGLRVIAINSIILGHTYHVADGKSQLDAGNEQMNWLEAQLQDAKGKDKVLIAMHIPPGNDAYAVSRGKQTTEMWSHLAKDSQQPNHQTWLNRFLDLISTHADTVVGLAYGHTHMDELRRLHDHSGKIIAVAISCPGITTNHGNNPGFKVVSYDSKTKELQDFVTYYTHKTTLDGVTGNIASQPFSTARHQSPPAFWNA